MTDDIHQKAIEAAADQLLGYIAPQLAAEAACAAIDAYERAMWRPIEEAQDVAAIIAERDAAIRERDEARAALASAREDALEEAAMVIYEHIWICRVEAERVASDADKRHFTERAARLSSLAGAIRALKEATPAGQRPLAHKKSPDALTYRAIGPILIMSGRSAEPE